MRNKLIYNICLRLHDILNRWMIVCPWSYNLSRQPEYGEYTILIDTYCSWVDGR